MKRRNVQVSPSEYANETNIWVSEQPFLKNLLNAYNVLVPDSEHFIIRTVKQFTPKISYSLRDAVKILFYQEGLHARETSKVYEWVKKAYRITGFKKFCYWITYAWLEKIAPKRILLALASAIEHINTTTSEYFIQSDHVLEKCPTRIKQIFYWHFAEEIEHKAVVFDVLQEVSTSRVLRIIGMVLAAIGFSSLLMVGSFYFSLQDKSIFKRPFWIDFKNFLFSKNHLLRLWIKRNKIYCYKNFHPDSVNNTSLIPKALNIVNRLSEELQS